MKFKVSIIIPTYNCEKYIARCLKSVFTQSYNNLEIIVIDDGSTDKTNEICKKLKNEDHRLVYIKKDNGGVSSARNLGLQRATGDYIIFVDSDDTIDNFMIEHMLNKIKDYDCVYCKYKKITRNKEILINEINIKNLNQKQVLSYYIGDKRKYKKNIIIKNSIMGSVWRILFKKSILEGLKFDNNLKYSEDFVFIMQILNKNPKINYVDEYLYNYYENDISFSSSKNLKKIDYIFQIIPYMTRYFDAKIYKQKLDYFYIETILNIYYILKQNNLTFKDLDEQKYKFVKENLKFKKIINFSKNQSNIKLTILALLLKFSLKKGK